MSRVQRKLNRHKPFPCSTRPKPKPRYKFAVKKRKKPRTRYVQGSLIEDIKTGLEQYMRAVMKKLNIGA